MSLKHLEKLDNDVLETMNREFFKRVFTKLFNRMKDELNNEVKIKLINEIDQYGGCLLHYIAALDYYELIPLLHESGADLNIKA